MTTIEPTQQSGRGLGVHRAVGRSTKALLVVLACFLLLGAFYSWSVPPFEGPDEAQHFAYVQWLAEGKGFPPQGDAAWETAIEQEAGQPPLYYLLASLPARWVGDADPPAVYRPNPHFVGPFPRTTFDNDNRAIHYPSDARPLAGGWLALYLARGLSLCFGLLLIVAVHGLGRQVAPTQPQIGLGAALLTAMTPQVLYVGGLVSNDIPAAALGAVALWLLAIMLRERASPSWALAVGAALGLAALAKVSALALLAPCAIGLAWLWLSGRQSLGKVLLLGGVMALGMALICGWWFLRCWRLYGQPLGLEAHDKTPWAIAGVDPGRLAGPLTRWWEVARTYWLAFGWGTIRMSEWVYRSLFLLELAALAGLGLAARRWRRQPSPRVQTKPVMLGLLALYLVVTAVLLEVWMRRVTATWGRLLFPAIPAVSMLLVVGWRAIHPKLAMLPGSFLAVWALAAPFWLLLPAYRMPMLTAKEAGALPPSLGVRYGESYGGAFAELISASPLRTSAESNTLVPVRLCWRALGPAAGDYSVLVHIVGPDDKLIANRRTYPGLGRYPTSTWRAGDLFCDVVNVALGDEPAKTLVYRIEVVFLNEEQDRRLPAYDRNGQPLPQTFFSQVRLVAPRSVSPFIPEPGSPVVQLIKYEVPNPWEAGGDHQLTLGWGITEPLIQDYQVYLHLREPATGRIVAQSDGPPRDGWYPTTWWPVGEVVRDKHTFALPADVPPGEYHLFAGLYELASGQRPFGEHFLGTVRVVEPDA